MKKRERKRPPPVKRSTPRKPSAPPAMAAAASAAPVVRARTANVGPSRTAPEGFPIVGIGASAGGLEALEEFLKSVPPRSGMAFVIVQHLDPTHKGAMVELLQRATAMQVVQVKDRQQVERDVVYVIPPNKDMSILHGVLHLLPPASPRGLNLPIDFFFRSLAEDQQERSIGVVLSGMGSDGTLGLRAIKEKAGAGFAQSLASAKFSGMPRSVIEAGLADVVATATEIPGRIIAYLRHAPYVKRPDETFEDKQLSALEKVLILLRTHTGSDFSLYKRSTIYRRVERRMGLHQLDKIANYVRLLRENPSEIDLLFKELLIGVTSFFRDPASWDHLRDSVVGDLLRSRGANGSVIRAWVPGCSTGEEAYSLAIVLSEACDRLEMSNVSFQIFATDVDRDAIEKARQGVYPSNVAADVSPERLRRFFVHDERGYRVRKEIREAVVFAPQNVIMDAPFTKLDILSCRNLLIYLAPELQKRLIPLFHYVLNPRGILFLGSAETAGTFASLFAPANGKHRIYRRLDAPLGAHAVDFPPTFAAPQPEPLPESERLEPSKAALSNLPLLADRVIVQHFAPTAILTTDKGDILYISGRTGKYLEPAVGKANLNVFAMAREGLRYELSGAFATARRQDVPVTLRGIRVVTNGSTQSVDVVVQKLAEPRELRGTMMIALSDVAPAPKRLPRGNAHRAEDTARGTDDAARVGELERELQNAREEMQTSQEELKSTNEELQSTNEELQSTNEELTTSKEEMQSMNEELQTVNHELQSKVDELSRSNNDMKNLLNSTDVATLFLDGALLVRRFTTQTSQIIKLIPADAGRPITDIATELNYPQLVDDARDVLRTLVFKETEVPTRDGRWFTVRILPYRTLENVIDGVVITFMDATVAKRLEAALRQKARELQQMNESLPNLFLGFRADGACESLNSRWIDYTGVPEGEQIGYGWIDHLHPDERERVRDQWKAALRAGAPLETEFRVRSKTGAHRWFKVGLAPIRDEKGAIARWYATCADIEDLKRAASIRDREAARLESILEGIGDAVISLDESLAVANLNAAAEKLFDRKRDQVLGRSFAESFPDAIARGLESKIRAAVRARRPISLRAAAGADGTKTKRLVRIFPHTGGVSVFCKNGEET